MDAPNETHSVLVGYILPMFGLMGIHRFHMGKWITGIIYLFTAGLLGLGLLYDLSGARMGR